MNRVTVVDTINHQLTNGKPKCVVSRFSMSCASDEEAYSRRMKVGEAWMPLDFGYIDAASMVVLENEADIHVVNLTEAEKAEAAKRIVEVSGGWEIHPGQSMRGTASRDVQVRSKSGIVNLRIYVFPR